MKKRWIIGPVVVLGAVVLAVFVLGGREPDRPRLEIRPLGWTNLANGQLAVSLLLTNPSRWVVTRHAECLLFLEELGDRRETLLPARELLPGTQEAIVVGAPDLGVRWKVEFPYTAWETGWQWRMRRWRESLGGFGFLSRPRSPRPDTVVTGTVATGWLTNVAEPTLPK